MQTGQMITPKSKLVGLKKKKTFRAFYLRSGPFLELPFPLLFVKVCGKFSQQYAIEEFSRFMFF